MKVWIRILPEEHPSYVNQAAASSGFRRLGADVTGYVDINEILPLVSADDKTVFRLFALQSDYQYDKIAI